MQEVSGGQPAVDAQNLWALQRMHQFQPSEWVSRINCSTTTGWFNKKSGKLHVMSTTRNAGV